MTEPDVRQAGKAGVLARDPAGGDDRELLAPLLPAGEPVE